jgi:hypothetical protein
MDHISARVRDATEAVNSDKPRFCALFCCCCFLQRRRRTQQQHRTDRVDLDNMRVILETLLTTPSLSMETSMLYKVLEHDVPIDEATRSFLFENLVNEDVAMAPGLGMMIHTEGSDDNDDGNENGSNSTSSRSGGGGGTVVSTPGQMLERIARSNSFFNPSSVAQHSKLQLASVPATGTFRQFLKSRIRFRDALPRREAHAAPIASMCTALTLMSHELFSMHVPGVLEWDFDVIAFAATHTQPMGAIVVSLFKSFHLFERLRLDKAVVFRCLATIQCNYEKRNPFHNALHGIGVCHAMAYLLRQTQVCELLDAHEILACLMAALCRTL